MAPSWTSRIPSGAAAGVVGDDGVEVAGARDDVFAWASVTKVVTTLAVLVAVEEGSVGLEDPAGPTGSTVAHLLAHTSGLGPDGTVILAAPGTRRIYSNAGFEILGEHLAAATGMVFEEYLAEAVLDPLGIGRGRFAPGASAAHGMGGTIVDLAAVAGELRTPRLISQATSEMATRTWFPGIKGVLPGFGRQDPCDWGLGFEVKDGKAPHWTGSRNTGGTFGHFGQAGGFVWIDPGPRAACCYLSDRPFGPWAKELWPGFSDGVLDYVAGTKVDVTKERRG